MTDAINGVIELTEEPDTIDELEFLLNSAIKWQQHSRTSYILIETLREMPGEFHSIADAQMCHMIESQVARDRLFRYMEIK